MSLRRGKAYFYLLVATVIWSVAGPVIKFTLGEISPLNFLSYRFGISALISLLLMTTGRMKLPQRKGDMFLLIACGLIGNTVALVLLFAGLDMTTVLDTSIIEAIIPLVVGYLGIRFLNERITKKEKAGTALALLGTLVTILGPLGESGAAGINDLERFFGNVLVLLFVFADSISFIIAKKLTQRRVEPETISNLSFIVAFISTAPIALLVHGTSGLWNEIATLPYPHHAGVWFMAVFSGTAAYWLWMKGQKTIEASEAALFRYLIPIFSAPIALYWLGEKLSVHFAAGAALIAIGVVIAEYKGRA